MSLLLLGLSLSAPPASAYETTYSLRPTALSAATGRAALAPDLRRLPSGVTAAPPRVDGGMFVVTVAPGALPVASTRDVTDALAAILPALGLSADPTTLRLVREGERLPGPDAGVLTAQGELRTDAWIAETERRVGPLSEETVEALVEEGREAADRATAPVQLWSFQQEVGGARAESRVVRVAVDASGIRHIVGALYEDTTAGNTQRIGADEAIRYAERHAGGIGGRATGTPELVALGDGAVLRYAWRVWMETGEGDYLLDVDADTGDIVQIEPLFWAFTEGRGRVAMGDLPATFDVYGFGVDDASGCDHTLGLDGVMTITNVGGDGFTGDATACLVAGVADFDVPANNDTTNVMDATDTATYNPRFAHVNAYAWVYEAVEWFEASGSDPVPELDVYFADTGACGGGINGACGGLAWLRFGVGGATIGLGGLQNAALDATAAVHEVGHGVSRRRYFVANTTPNPSVGEALSDFWAMSMLDTDVVGVVITNTNTDVQTWGGLPRRADVDDVFPEQLQFVNQQHANGQVLSRALWEARREMDGRSPIGSTMLDTYLMAAVPASGAAQSGSQTELDVHNAYQGILLSLLVETGGGLPAADVLVGFAKAGLFVTAQEAVIDIDHDVLDGSSATPPVFRVWSGRDFVFGGLNTTSVVSAGFGDRYQIEVANDPDFTLNVRSSGVQSNIATIDGVPSADWQLSATDWNVLRQEDALYFKVTTWDSFGDPTLVRTSTHFYGEFFELPPGRALINHSGSGSVCGTATTGASVALVGIGALAAALRRRRGAKG